MTHKEAKPIYEKVKRYFGTNHPALTLNLTCSAFEEFLKASFEIAFDIFEKKSVWFTIDKTGSQYRILMYYDNKHNQANGEDL